jgi:hypothetical protein
MNGNDDETNTKRSVLYKLSLKKKKKKKKKKTFYSRIVEFQKLSDGTRIAVMPRDAVLRVVDFIDDSVRNPTTSAQPPANHPPQFRIGGPFLSMRPPLRPHCLV